MRRNVGNGYHGGLRVGVRRSTDLYRKIEGWAAAAMAGSSGLADQANAADTRGGHPDPSDRPYGHEASDIQRA